MLRRCTAPFLCVDLDWLLSGWRTACLEMTPLTESVLYGGVGAAMTGSKQPAAATRGIMDVLFQRHAERHVLPRPAAFYRKHLRANRGARCSQRLRPRALPPEG